MKTFPLQTFFLVYAPLQTFFSNFYIYIYLFYIWPLFVHSIIYCYPKYIRNTANQNTGKPLYIRRYSTQPSHRALRSYR